MKVRRMLLGLLSIITFIAIQGGCHRSSDVDHKFLFGNPHRVVSISVGDVPNKCEVDFPVTLLRMGKNTIAWAAVDQDYWIRFTPTSPIGTNDIKVPKGNATSRYSATSAGYFTYAIYDVDPNTPNSTPCKAADDDRDTGLNVKR